MRIFLALIFVIVSAITAQYYFVKHSIDSNTIYLGMSGPLSGGVNSVGTQFLMGANIYLSKLNANGGVEGKKIEIIAKDDRYEPKIAIENVKNLIEKYKVFALFGIIGTPVAEAVFPTAVEKNIPFVGAYTGAEFLRTPPNPIVLNARASDYDEAQKLLKYYIDKLKLKRIAIFYQNDAYGRAGLKGIKDDLQRRNLSLVGEGSYKRNTLSVGNALYEIEQCDPEVILMIGSTAASAEFIKRVRKSEKIKKSVHFGLFSFIEPTQLIHLLDYNGKGITFAQVVPSPWTSEGKEVNYYRQLMNEYHPKEDLSYASLEGYFAARMITEVFKSVGPSLSKEAFIAKMNAFSKTVGEKAVQTNLDQKCNCLHNVHLSEYDDGFFAVWASHDQPF